MSMGELARLASPGGETMTTKKKAKFAGIEAVNVSCPKCGELCVTPRGSQMVCRGDTEVTCENCAEVYELPTRVINLFLTL
jgi:ribosomal protein S27E